jgi:transcriptional regulator GlxA family with amidase domain
MRTVVLTGQAPVQILDLAGPLEVFASAPGYRIVIGAHGGEHLLQTSRGFALTNAVPLEEVSGPIDTLVVVGGPGSETGEYDRTLIAWLVEASKRSRRIASVCTGTFLLAAAGLLNGKKAVTHWNACDRLARDFPNVSVQCDPIFMRDGNVYTSAGISSGIDLALALIEEDHGHQVALNVARRLVMFLVRPGGQSQFSHMLSRQAIASQPLRELHVWMLEHLQEDLTVERLAERMNVSTRHFTRIFLRETGMNPGEFVDRMRVEAAQQQIDASSTSLKEIAQACGFRDTNSMRRGFLRILGVTPSDYIDRFKRRDHS